MNPNATEPELIQTLPSFNETRESQNKLLQALGAPHISSFNHMLEGGLLQSIKNSVPIYLTLNNDKIILWFNDVQIEYSTVPLNTIGVKNHKVYPTECRQRGISYTGNIIVKLGWSINGNEQTPLERKLGEIPLMLKSNRCHLNKMSPKELIAHGEHEQEWGGYFIIKGIERILRMLIMTRRNYPIACRRANWKSRGDDFSDLGIFLRSVRNDNTTMINVLHYVTDGNMKFSFTYNRNTYYVSLILMLKCLKNAVDTYILKNLIAQNKDDGHCITIVRNMLGELHEQNLHWHEQCKIYLGKSFKIKITELPSDASYMDVCDYIIKHCVFVHLDDLDDKFNLLIYMAKKLFSLSKNKCAVENMDAVMMQECLLGGHLYQQILKDKLYMWLKGVKTNILKRASSAGNRYVLTMQEMMNVTKLKCNVGMQMEMFLATGNVRLPAEAGLMQSSGYSIILENINRMRYMSHFRAIHRGAIFQEMRTVEHRRLLPDSWGFICPIHTPDGVPCGLLNHLTMNCIVTKHPCPKLKAALPGILVELGMMTLLITDDWVNSYTVMLDGEVIGLIKDKIINTFVYSLRMLKIEGKKVPLSLEIVLVPKKKVPAQYPGLFLFTSAARLMRPVINLAARKIEYIGTFEQIYMEICVSSKKAHKLTTHQELSKTCIFSNMANFIPLPDCNQSPRNMYQCQMAKQTMGTPCYNWLQQAQSKLYRLQTPAVPFFRPVHFDKLDMTDFPMGTNAIIAIISYSGYDMEDAIVINKASFERGFGYGSVYKSEFVNLTNKKSYFCRDPKNRDLKNTLDPDGLPIIGIKIKEKEAYYCYYDADKNTYIVGFKSGSEDVYVDSVKLCGVLNNQESRRACITFRIPRKPEIGDKFASRAGQKGILSRLYPVEDLPFTETGMVPDILFNPHGFPSRMTIAMMYEVMAGKSAAVHGVVHDATPFRFNEEETAVDFFGKLLKLGGYNYYGCERMYSGIYGCEMTASIFFGIVHYQRLRHMVSDKWQVRRTGAIDMLTRQPIKGRRRGGGVRFGEMERDALIAHGCSYILHDRLLNCSDKVTILACIDCGSILGSEIFEKKCNQYRKCRLCGKADSINEIEIPYTFKHLLVQLATCNIKIKLNFKHI